MKEDEMAYRVKMARKLFNRFLKRTLGVYLTRRYRIEYDDKDIQGLEPPFLVVANHTNNWDPFILSVKIKEPIHFVTSIEQFRSPVMQYLLSLVGCIPKTKSMSDATTVKSLFVIRNNGGVSGVFPEGKRCWDGKSEEMLYPTAKLLKAMKIPVVYGLFHGAYLAHPRWAEKPRKGKIHLKYGILFTENDIKNMSVDEIYDHMCKTLQTNEYIWQEERMISFRGPRLAESLELCLFICPSCMSVGKLYSKGDTCTCLSCGEHVKYNEYGYFEKDGGEPVFKSVQEWNQWQLKRLEEMIVANMSNADKPVFEDSGVTLFTGEPYKPLRKDRKGSIRFFADRIEFTDLAGTVSVYGLDHLNGVSTHLNDRFDFYHNGVFHRFAFKDHHTSANKWSEAYDIVKRLRQESDEGS